MIIIIVDTVMFKSNFISNRNEKEYVTYISNNDVIKQFKHDKI